jgi:hypothetical protein
MSLPIYVDAYSAYKANERPRKFDLDKSVFEIEAIESQWRSPGATLDSRACLQKPCSLLPKESI